MNKMVEWGLIIGAGLVGTFLIYEHVVQKNLSSGQQPKGLALLHVGTRFQATGIDPSTGLQRTGNFIATSEPNYQRGNVFANNENNVEVSVSLAAITSVG